MAVVDPTFRHISWIIADNDPLTDKRRDEGINVSQALKPDAIAVNGPQSGHGEEQ
jgi:hypothetical protein